MEIRPITILIGKNSAGKSVVSRLPLLLRQSLSQSSSAPIELQFDGLEFGGSFKDLVHNRIDHGHISFGLTYQEGENIINIDFTIQNIADSPLQLISKYKITYSTEFEISLDWHISTNPSDIGVSQIYQATGNVNGNVEVKFKGILIDSIINIENKQELLPDNLILINQKIIESAVNIDYIGPFRVLPKRDYIYKGSKPKNTGYSGEFAPHILGIDSYLDKNIINSVGNWFKTYLGGWTLEVEKIRDKFEIVLTSPDDRNVKVNLVDVGHGMSQVLPLIVRSFFKKEVPNAIMIVEQPELHLHPAAHAELAEQFVNIINEEKSSWIIETHSEVFILRIRRLVAEKKLPANNVIIYQIDDEERPGSKLKRILLDENGEVSDWPKGVFSEDYEEIVALRKAQKS